MRSPTMISLVAQLEADDLMPNEAPSGEHRLDLSKRISWRKAVGEIPPPLDMVVPGLQAGKVGVIGGAGASSKTMLALQAAISVAGGSDFFGLFGGVDIRAGRVVYLSLEDDQHALWIREHAISKEIENGLRSGAMLDNGVRRVPEKDLPAALEALTEKVDRNLEVLDLYGQGLRFAMKEGGRVVPCEEHIEQLLPILHGARLVVVDTLNRAASAGSLDENSAGDMGALLVALERICAQIGCALIVLHHINKGGMSDGEAESLTQDILRGSSVIVDNARWVLMLRVMNEAQSRARFGNSWESEKPFWVRREIVKQNHGMPVVAAWLRRATGGVLNAFTMPPPKQATSPRKSSASTRRAAQE